MDTVTTTAGRASRIETPPKIEIASVGGVRCEV
jgi:hypothetical protein